MFFIILQKREKKIKEHERKPNSLNRVVHSMRMSNAFIYTQMCDIWTTMNFSGKYIETDTGKKPSCVAIASVACLGSMG